jgi:hypothetical protein
MRFARGDLRIHIDSYKNDHPPSYWPQKTLRQQQCLKIDFREIFGVFRFSTFSTASTPSRHRLIFEAADATAVGVIACRAAKV